MAHIQSSDDRPPRAPEIHEKANARSIVWRVPFNFVFQAQWLMVKVTKSNPADYPHRWIENDNPPARCKHPRKLLERSAGVLQVVPNIEQDQMTHLSLAKRKMVGILYAVQPWIRKNVGSDCLRNVFLDISHARAKLHDQAGNSRVQLAGDLAIELRINLAKQRLFIPELAVLEDLDIVLFNT